MTEQKMFIIEHLFFRLSFKLFKNKDLDIGIRVGKIYLSRRYVCLFGNAAYISTVQVSDTTAAEQDTKADKLK